MRGMRASRSRSPRRLRPGCGADGERTHRACARGAEQLESKRRRTLHIAPSRLELHFSEAVLAEATRIDLRDGDGRAMHRVSRVVLDEQAENVTETPPRMQPDACRVDWRTVSARDLHPDSGKVEFEVQRSADGGRAGAQRGRAVRRGS